MFKDHERMLSICGSSPGQRDVRCSHWPSPAFSFYAGLVRLVKNSDFGTCPADAPVGGHGLRALNRGRSVKAIAKPCKRQPK